MHNDHDEIVREIEINIETAKEAIAFGDAMDRLYANKDFQLVIDQGYMTAEARRLTLLSANPALTEEQRTAVLQSVRAIGELFQFFQVKRQFAEEMRKNLEVFEEGLAEVHAEADEENAE